MKTPLFIASREVLERNISRIRSHLRDSDQLLFAIKAFPARQAVAATQVLVDGFDASNLQEIGLLQDLDTGMLSFSGPAALTETLALSRKRPILVNVGDPSQLQDLHRTEAAVGIRVCVTDFLRDVSVPSRFGLGRSELAAACQHERVCGFQLHAPVAAQVDVALIRCFLDYIDHEGIMSPDRLRWLNLGGGWSVDRLTVLDGVVSELDARGWPTQIIAEPGQHLWSDACYIATRVLSIRRRRPHGWIIVMDVSPDAHLKWSRPIPVQISTSSELVWLAGPTSFEADVIGPVPMDLSTITVGGILLLQGICSYSYAWRTSFNGVAELSLLVD